MCLVRMVLRQVLGGLYHCGLLGRSLRWRCCAVRSPKGVVLRLGRVGYNLDNTWQQVDVHSLRISRLTFPDHFTT
jgi:hypothetical protein